MLNMFVPDYWTMEEALRLIRAIQPETRKFGYHLSLGGGVLNKGESKKDLDLYFLPLDREDVKVDSPGLLKWLQSVWGEGKRFGGKVKVDPEGVPGTAGDPAIGCGAIPYRNNETMAFTHIYPTTVITTGTTVGYPLNLAPAQAAWYNMVPTAPPPAPPTPEIGDRRNGLTRMRDYLLGRGVREQDVPDVPLEFIAEEFVAPDPILPDDDQHGMNVIREEYPFWRNQRPTLEEAANQGPTIEEAMAQAYERARRLGDPEPQPVVDEMTPLGQGVDDAIDRRIEEALFNRDNAFLTELERQGRLARAPEIQAPLIYEPFIIPEELTPDYPEKADSPYLWKGKFNFSGLRIDVFIMKG